MKNFILGGLIEIEIGKASNRGRRLDHVWVSKKLFPQVKSGVIYKDTRSWERPSDHVPIILEIDI